MAGTMTNRDERPVLPGPAAVGTQVVLASGSVARAGMLRQAGLAFEARAAAVDEDEIKAAFRAEDAPAGALAEALAELKAQRVSRSVGDAFVIGADQVLDCEGVWFDKPGDMDAARAHLMALRGREHRLTSAVCVVRAGARLWHHTDSARLFMRPFSDAFLEAYLQATGPAVLESVGAYQLEGLGAQLFTRVQGDYFTVLGMPLLPLLDFLRTHGVLQS
jgi:septum formation protein